jgi:hypothetical protein
MTIHYVDMNNGATTSLCRRDIIGKTGKIRG